MVQQFLSRVDSFTNDAGGKERSNVIFFKKEENTEANIRTIKTNSFRRNMKDQISDKGKKSGADVSTLFYSFNQISHFDFHLNFFIDFR